jgi:hypothetical protein
MCRDLVRIWSGRVGIWSGFGGDLVGMCRDLSGCTLSEDLIDTDNFAVADVMHLSRLFLYFSNKSLMSDRIFSCLKRFGDRQIFEYFFVYQLDMFINLDPDHKTDQSKLERQSNLSKSLNVCVFGAHDIVIESPL